MHAPGAAVTCLWHSVFHQIECAALALSTVAEGCQLLRAVVILTRDTGASRLSLHAAEALSIDMQK